MTVALVSGANRGIGLEVARELARDGHHVLLGARSLEAGERAAALLDGLDITPISKAAMNAMWAARLGPDGPTGGFFRDGRPVPW